MPLHLLHEVLELRLALVRDDGEVGRVGGVRDEHVEERVQRRQQRRRAGGENADLTAQRRRACACRELDLVIERYLRMVGFKFQIHHRK